MPVLVTGGAGFIGSHLVRSLVRSGHEVAVVDNLRSTSSLSLLDDVLDRIEFFHIDIRCPEDLALLPCRHHDRIFHLAASFANELSIKYPVIDTRTNSEGTANILAYAAREGCDLFVYTGSSSSYGDARVPMVEDGPVKPQTPYAQSKLAGEQHTLTSGLPYAIFRLFNVYGPGEAPGPYRNAIPNMMKALDAPDGRIRIFGREATRDFNHVGDVVAYLLDAEAAKAQVVNIGSGSETRIEELARMILQVFDRSSESLCLEAPRPWDRVRNRCADVSRLGSIYGAVRRTDMLEGLRETARWLYESEHISMRPV